MRYIKASHYCCLSRQRPLRKLNAQLARQSSETRNTVVILVNAAVLSIAWSVREEGERNNKSPGDGESSEVAESKRN